MGVRIGLKNVYYAEMLTDVAGGATTYDTPVRLAGAITANINPNSSMETLFADDGPLEVATALGNVELELNMSDISLTNLAFLLGHDHTSGVMTSKASDVPPWVAIGFQALKSNGEYRYVWLLKGKFSEPEQSHETKGDTINWQTPTITGNFAKRDSDDAWKRDADGDDEDFIEATGTDWFTAGPNGGTPDTTPPTVSTVNPPDGETNVVIATDIVWTFSEAIKAASVVAPNFIVYKASDYTVVAGALTYNNLQTIITFNPTSNLTNSEQYVCVVGTGVEDAAGNHLAAPHITDFTTVAP